MINKKNVIIFMLLLCLIFTFVMTGCQAADNSNNLKNYDFRVFFGDVDEPIEIDALLTEYEEKTGLKIEPIIMSEEKDHQGTLEALLSENTPPAIYAVASDVDENWLTKGGYVADFSSIDKSMEGTSIAYDIDGYGLAYDRAMFDEIFGAKPSEKLISDLRTCNYKDWTVFLSALDDYINGRTSTKFPINGHNYKFPAQKGTLTDGLNGIFAFAGADGSVYGTSIMDIVLQTVKESDWKRTDFVSSSAALKIMNPALTIYADGLDLYTTYLSGEYSSGIRGADFVNEEYYSKLNTNAMFMSGKAMFMILDSAEYSDVKALNAQKAKTLEYLPVKLPYKGKRNKSIPANVSYSLYINDTMSKDTKKESLEFLSWFAGKEEQWSNSLNLSIKTYVENENTLDYKPENKEFTSWEKDIFGDEGIRLYLKKEIWSDEYKNEMKTYMMEQWIEK